MGYRLHHTTTYKVEYGQGFFNHSGAELEELLQAIFPSFYTNDESTHWKSQKMNSKHSLTIAKTEQSHIISIDIYRRINTMNIPTKDLRKN